MLVFDALGVDSVDFEDPTPPAPEDHRILDEFYETWRGVQPKNVQESWHDTQQALEEARSLFKFGYLGMRDLARAEHLFWSCCEKISQSMRRLKYVPEDAPGDYRLKLSVQQAEVQGEVTRLLQKRGEGMRP